jgi:ribosomal protein L29
MATKKQKVQGGDAQELLVSVEKKREELRGLRFAGAGSKNRNVKLTRVLRKQIARALTEVRAQELKQAQN